MFQEPTILERDRNKFEWLLRQLLAKNGCLAHLKIAADFADGILNINIDTDPRAIQFIFPNSLFFQR